MKDRVERAQAELRAAVKVVVEACRLAHGYVPGPIFNTESWCYIYGDGDEHPSHSKAVRFLWDNGVDADLMESVGID